MRTSRGGSQDCATVLLPKELFRSKQKPARKVQGGSTPTMKQSTSLLLCVGNMAIGSSLGARADVEVDCFALDATSGRTLMFNSYGACSSDCASAGSSVFAVRGNICVCLDSLPPDDDKADTSKCNLACPGYSLDSCKFVLNRYSVCTVSTVQNMLTHRDKQAAVSQDITP